MKYTIEFKQKIVALAVAGKPKREIAREYNIGEATIYQWIEKYGSDDKTKELTDLERENLALKDELRKTQIERDILKQAALIMAQSPKP